MQNSLFFIVKTLADLYLLTFVVRFILQWIQADFYNPISQFILRVTNPLVVPVRRLLPSVRGIDVPTLTVLVLLQGLTTWSLLAIADVSVSAIEIVQYVLMRLVSLTLWFYSISILICVILSWIAQVQYSPAVAILRQIVEPVLRPVRRLLPPIGGLDLSPLLVLIVIQAIVIALPLPGLLR